MSWSGFKSSLARQRTSFSARSIYSVILVWFITFGLFQTSMFLCRKLYFLISLQQVPFFNLLPCPLKSLASHIKRSSPSNFCNLFTHILCVRVCVCLLSSPSWTYLVLTSRKRAMYAHSVLSPFSLPSSFTLNSLISLLPLYEFTLSLIIIVMWWTYHSCILQSWTNH